MFQCEGIRDVNKKQSYILRIVPVNEYNFRTNETILRNVPGRWFSTLFVLFNYAFAILARERLVLELTNALAYDSKIKTPKRKTTSRHWLVRPPLVRSNRDHIIKQNK